MRKASAVKSIIVSVVRLDTHVYLPMMLQSKQMGLFLHLQPNAVSLAHAFAATNELCQAETTS